MKRTLLSISILVLSFFCFQLTAQDYSIYETMEIYEHPNNDGQYGFVSLSESYRLNSHPDFSAIPKSAFNKDKVDEYVVLTGKYRNQILEKLQLSESDSLSIYNYKERILYQFPLRQLKAIALLSPYETGGPVTQDGYYIGFEFKADNISDLDHLLAYVGKKNPFTHGQLEPIIWTPIDSMCFPNGYESEKLKQSKGDNVIKNTYTFYSKEYDYYLQESATKSWSNGIRHLLIINRKTNSVDFNAFYMDNDYGELSPLSFTNPSSTDSKMYYQWTGYLLNNKPQVVFGFNDFTFGCQSIDFISKSEKPITVKCDNRH